MAGAAETSDESERRDEVVTCFLRHRGEVLLVRRSARVGSYKGRWGAIAGFAEGDPEEAARREIAEETGLEGEATLVARGEPFAFEDPDEGRRWRVHPFLFDVATRNARLDWEADEGEWVSPTEILTRETVPRLWTSYQRVAPSVAALRDDRDHGSAWLSLRALETLRDRAAALAGGEAEGNARSELPSLAHELIAARPAMTAVHNRVSRAMSRAVAEAPSATDLAAAVQRAAEATLRAAIDAEEGVAAEVAREVAGHRVLTLSLSGTVLEGLVAADPAPARVVVCASLPGGEGASLAARLAAAGLDVVLVPDAAVAWALEVEDAELLLVGADTVLADGAVVNKVGTRPAALAAHAAGVPVVAAASSDKVAAAGETWSREREEADASGTGARPGGVAGGHGPERRSPLFERTPAALIDGVATERGVLTLEGIKALAAEHAARRAWDGSGPPAA